MPAHTLRRAWRADAVSGFASEVVLDQAILQRVERNHREARASAIEQAVGQREHRFQAVHFLVDSDPQGLERQSGGVNLTFPTSSHGLLDGVD